MSTTTVFFLANERTSVNVIQRLIRFAGGYAQIMGERRRSTGSDMRNDGLSFLRIVRVLLG